MWNFVVVRGDRVYNLLRFAMAAEQIRADEGMRSFHFVAEGFADVVKESGAFRCRDIETDFRCHQSREMGDLHAVIQNILRKAVAETQAPEHFHDFRLHGGQAGFLHGVFACAHNRLVHFLRDFGDDLLDPRGVDTAVQNETLHGFTRDFAPDRIEPGRGLERPDVTAFPADDPAFEFFVGQGQGGAGGFERVFSGVALDGHADDAAGLFFRTRLGLFHDSSREDAGILERFCLDLFQQLRFGLGFREFGCGLQALALLLQKSVQFDALLFGVLKPFSQGTILLAQVLLLLNHALELLVYKHLAFDKPFLGFCQALTPLGKGEFRLLPEFNCVFIGLEAHFTGYILSLPAGVFENGLFLDGKGRAQISLFPAQEPIPRSRAAHETGKANHTGIIQKSHFKTEAKARLPANASESGCNSQGHHAVRAADRRRLANQKQPHI